MNIISLSGDYYEVGYGLGKMLKSRIKNIPQYKKIKKNFIPIVEKDVEENISIVEKHFPEFLRELNGFCDATGFDFEVHKKILSGRSKGSCSIFGIKNKDNLFVGRTYDWMKGINDLCTFSFVNNKEAFSSISCSDMLLLPHHKMNYRNLWPGPEDGINERGLFIGLTFAHVKEQQAGLPCFLVIQRILDKCKNVDRAVSFLKKVELQYPHNFFVADKSGKMRIVECTLKEREVVRPEKNILIKTNHFTHPNLKEKDKVFEDSVKRYSYIEKTLEKSKPSLEVIKKITRNKKSGVCCSSGGQETLWSWVMNISKGNYWLCPGNPDKKSYEKIEFL